MKKSLRLRTLATLMIVCLPLTTVAQTLSSGDAVVTVSFSFKSAPTGVVGYQGTDGDNRFYIEFPTSNRPTASISNIETAVEIRKEKEKSNDRTTVYSVTFRRGTSPRFGQGGSISEMVLTFTPEDSSLVADSAPPARLSVSAVATDAATNGADEQTPSTPNQPRPSAFDEAAQKLNLANLDLSVPESPAFTVLGLTPQTVIRPTSPRQFASSLLNGIDQRGNLQSGLALDAAPYLIYAGDRLTLKRYRESYFLRFLARAQTSFATTKGASEGDKSIRAAVGFNFTLMDKGDPHSDADLMKCFKDKLQLPPPPSSISPTGEIVLSEEDQRKRDEISAKNVAAAEECRAEGRKRNWNRSSWVIALAPAWISPTGETRDFRYDGGGIWTSIAYGFEGVPGLENTSQLIFHARYRDNETVPEPDMEGQFFRQDGLFLGLRGRAGTENSSVSFEGVFQRLRRVGMPFDNSSRLALGLERKIADNIWFDVAFGGQTDVPDGKRKGFVLTTFRWGFSQQRTFQTPNR
ncbi:MAG: hypothetical protein AB1631_14140 [Acidobacteriota bacterium]